MSRPFASIGRAISLCVAALVSCLAIAGEYSVSPLRVELDRNARTGVVTLANSGSDSIDFQISMMEWSQDADGRDRYAQAADVVYFPKILTLKPGESRVVRVGVQALPVATERTFRMFIDPIPARGSEAMPPGANIAVNVRFALPVFAKPVKREPAADVAGEMRKGTLAVTVANTGNEHQRFNDGVAVKGRDTQGREILTRKLDVRYVLAGAKQTAVAAIPGEICLSLAEIELGAQSEALTLNRKLAVDRASCE